MADGKPLLSMVVPVLNEQEVLPETRATLTRVLEGVGLPFEVVVVDNGSTDQTPALMAAICRADPRWKYLRLSRNFYRSRMSLRLNPSRSGRKPQRQMPLLPKRRLRPSRRKLLRRCRPAKRRHLPLSGQSPP